MAGSIDPRTTSRAKTNSTGADQTRRNAMRQPDPTFGGIGAMKRRQFLQVGYSGLLGMGLPGLLAARGARAAASGPATGRARSVIVILLSGGLGQHDSFDMKPGAP